MPRVRADSASVVRFYGTRAASEVEEEPRQPGGVSALIERNRLADVLVLCGPRWLKLRAQHDQLRRQAHLEKAFGDPRNPFGCRLGVGDGASAIPSSQVDRGTLRECLRLDFDSGARRFADRGVLKEQCGFEQIATSCEQ